MLPRLHRALGSLPQSVTTAATPLLPGGREAAGPARAPSAPPSAARAAGAGRARHRARDGLAWCCWARRACFCVSGSCLSSVNTAKRSSRPCSCSSLVQMILGSSVRAATRLRSSQLAAAEPPAVGPGRVTRPRSRRPEEATPQRDSDCEVPVPRTLERHEDRRGPSPNTLW